MEEAWKLTERQRKEGWRYVVEGRAGEGDMRETESQKQTRERRRHTEKKTVMIKS